jgi:hypothetical protein
MENSLGLSSNYEFRTCLPAEVVPQNPRSQVLSYRLDAL